MHFSSAIYYFFFDHQRSTADPCFKYRNYIGPALLVARKNSVSSGVIYRGNNGAECAFWIKTRLSSRPIFFQRPIYYFFFSSSVYPAGSKKKYLFFGWWMTRVRTRCFNYGHHAFAWEGHYHRVPELIGSFFIKRLAGVKLLYFLRLLFTRAHSRHVWPLHFV